MELIAQNEAPGRSYVAFWDIQDVLADLYAARFDIAGANKYWFVEHVLWFNRHGQQETPNSPRDRGATIPPISVRHYMQYIPPVLQDFLELGSGEGNSLLFENQVIQLFRMLGFRVDGLGQGKGREPDGIAYC